MVRASLTADDGQSTISAVTLNTEPKTAEQVGRASAYPTFSWSLTPVGFLRLDWEARAVSDLGWPRICRSDPTVANHADVASATLPPPVPVPFAQWSFGVILVAASKLHIEFTMRARLFRSSYHVMEIHS